MRPNIRKIKTEMWKEGIERGERNREGEQMKSICDLTVFEVFRNQIK